MAVFMVSELAYLLSRCQCPDLWREWRKNASVKGNERGKKKAELDHDPPGTNNVLQDC